MITVDQACDYLITRALASEPSRFLSLVKLQWLLYCSQCRHFAHHGSGLFDGPFEAWVEGPVNRSIRHRFKPAKLMYSAVTLADRGADFQPQSIPQESSAIMDGVVEEYAHRPDNQLEILIQADGPWSKARESLMPGEASRNLIDEGAMLEQGKSACGLQPSLAEPGPSPAPAGPLDVISEMLQIDGDAEVPPGEAVDQRGS